MTGLRAERIDQGIDFAGIGPIYAIGNGVVVNTLNAGWPGGAFICYRLTEGQYTGKYVYAAEDIHPAVSVGQTVTSNTVLGTVFSGGSGIETGWAAAPGTGETMARAAGQIAQPPQDPGMVSSAYGVAFSGFLKYLGAPAGIKQAVVLGTVPADYEPPSTTPPPSPAGKTISAVRVNFSDGTAMSLPVTGKKVAKLVVSFSAGTPQVLP